MVVRIKGFFVTSLRQHRYTIVVRKIEAKQTIAISIRRNVYVKNKLCLGLLTAVTAAYLLRRLGMRWGATDDEVHSPLPGDDLVPHPMLETTHAISIHASPAAIWPW